MTATTPSMSPMREAPHPGKVSTCARERVVAGRPIGQTSPILSDVAEHAPGLPRSF